MSDNSEAANNMNKMNESSVPLMKSTASIDNGHSVQINDATSSKGGSGSGTGDDNANGEHHGVDPLLLANGDKETNVGCGRAISSKTDTTNVLNEGHSNDEICDDESPPPKRFQDKEKKSTSSSVSSRESVIRGRSRSEDLDERDSSSGNSGNALVGDLEIEDSIKSQKENEQGIGANEKMNHSDNNQSAPGESHFIGEGVRTDVCISRSLLEIKYGTDAAGVGIETCGAEAEFQSKTGETLAEVNTKIKNSAKCVGVESQEEQNSAKIQSKAEPKLSCIRNEGCNDNHSLSDDMRPENTLSQHDHGRSQDLKEADSGGKADVIIDKGGSLTGCHNINLVEKEANANVPPEQQMRNASTNAKQNTQQLADFTGVQQNISPADAPPRPEVLPGHGRPVRNPNSNDVLSGRGARINSHAGNVRFREMVESMKKEYLGSNTKLDPNLEKARIAARLVASIRRSDPPGRFLKKDDTHYTGLWIEIGDERAWKKAMQALRESALKIRTEQQAQLKVAAAGLEGGGVAPSMLSTSFRMKSPMPEEYDDHGAGRGGRMGMGGNKQNHSQFINHERSRERLFRLKEADGGGIADVIISRSTEIDTGGSLTGRHKIDSVEREANENLQTEQQMRHDVPTAVQNMQQLPAYTGMQQFQPSQASEPLPTTPHEMRLMLDQQQLRQAYANTVQMQQHQPIQLLQGVQPLQHHIALQNLQQMQQVLALQGIHQMHQIHQVPAVHPLRQTQPAQPSQTSFQITRKVKDGVIAHSYHDYSGIDVSQIKRKVKNGVLNPFPVKLHQILDQVEVEGLDHIVSWQPHGRCFKIHKSKEFVDQIMPKYFRHSKMTSFNRQLNLYGFKRFTGGIDRGGWYHEKFLRGRLNLVDDIKRTRVKGTGVRLPAHFESEPDFYSMPPMKKSDSVIVKPMEQALQQMDPTTVANSNTKEVLRKVLRGVRSKDKVSVVHQLADGVSNGKISGESIVLPRHGGLVHNPNINDLQEKEKKDEQPRARLEIGDAKEWQQERLDARKAGLVEKGVDSGKKEKADTSNRLSYHDYSNNPTPDTSEMRQVEGGIYTTFFPVLNQVEADGMLQQGISHSPAELTDNNQPIREHTRLGFLDHGPYCHHMAPPEKNDSVISKSMELLNPNGRTTALGEATGKDLQEKAEENAGKTPPNNENNPNFYSIATRDEVLKPAEQIESNHLLVHVNEARQTKNAMLPATMIYEPPEAAHLFEQSLKMAEQKEIDSEREVLHTPKFFSMATQNKNASIEPKPAEQVESKHLLVDAEEVARKTENVLSPGIYEPNEAAHLFEQSLKFAEQTEIDSEREVPKVSLAQQMADTQTIIPPGHGGPVHHPNINDFILYHQSHQGNIRFLDLAESLKNDYFDFRTNALKRQTIIERLVDSVRQSEPAGRFLKKDGQTGEFLEIGDAEAWHEAILALRSAKNTQFPVKLHQILQRVEADGLAHIISWQQDGLGFIIHKPQEFNELIMPKYFQCTKMKTFSRRLHDYGFKYVKAGLDKVRWCHEKFQRGKISWACDINKIVNRNGARILPDKEKKESALILMKMEAKKKQQSLITVVLNTWKKQSYSAEDLTCKGIGEDDSGELNEKRARSKAKQKSQLIDEAADGAAEGEASGKDAKCKSERACDDHPKSRILISPKKAELKTFASDSPIHSSQAGMIDEPSLKEQRFSVADSTVNGVEENDGGEERRKDTQSKARGKSQLKDKVADGLVGGDISGGEGEKDCNDHPKSTVTMSRKTFPIGPPVLPGHGGIVHEPNLNDVILNDLTHPGTVRFHLRAERECIEPYIDNKRLQRLAKKLVHWIRQSDPPGRFLKLDQGLLNEVGDKVAWAKARRALRKNSPRYRAKHGDPMDQEIDDGCSATSRKARLHKKTPRPKKTSIASKQKAAKRIAPTRCSGRRSNQVQIMDPEEKEKTSKKLLGEDSRKEITMVNPNNDTITRDPDKLCNAGLDSKEAATNWLEHTPIVCSKRGSCTMTPSHTTYMICLECSGMEGKNVYLCSDSRNDCHSNFHRKMHYLSKIRAKVKKRPSEVKMNEDPKGSEPSSQSPLTGNKMGQTTSLQQDAKDTTKSRSHRKVDSNTTVKSLQHILIPRDIKGRCSWIHCPGYNSKKKKTPRAFIAKMACKECSAIRGGNVFFCAKCHSKFHRKRNLGMKYLSAKRTHFSSTLQPRDKKASSKNVPRRHGGPVSSPHDNDVLIDYCGDKQSYNVRFREIVESMKKKYLGLCTSSSKQILDALRLELVHSIRRLDPPGRFLEKDSSTGMWYEIGDKRALIKAGCALENGVYDQEKVVDAKQKSTND